MAKVTSLGRMFAVLSFLLLGASFVLQLVNSISNTYIHGLYFLKGTFDTKSAQVFGDSSVSFGIWGACVYTPENQRNQASGTHCTKVALGYQQDSIQKLFGSDNLPIQSPFLKTLPYALVRHPLSAGFTGLAAGAALLSTCTGSILWVLAGVWALVLTIATLVVELVLFVNAKDKFSEELANSIFADKFKMQYGPALWVQVAALATCLIGAMSLLSSYVSDDPTKSSSKTPADALRNDSYYAHQPQTRSTYDNVYGTESERMYQPEVPAYPPMTSSVGLGRAYNTNQPYETVPAPAPQREPKAHGDEYVDMEDVDLDAQAERRLSRARSNNLSRQSNVREQKRRSRRHSRSRSRNADAALRYNAEYDYDFDACPPHRISFENGAPAHVRRRSRPYDEYLTQPRSRRTSRLYDSGGDGEEDLAIRSRSRHAQDKRRQRYSDHFVY